MPPARGVFRLFMLLQLLACCGLVLRRDVGTWPRDVMNTSRSGRSRRSSHLLGALKDAGSHQRYGAVCSSTQCHNRATCVVDDHAVGGFKCQCVRGFYGLHCENVDPDCESNPCHNHAVCVVITAGYRCDCVGHFFGDHCQYNKTTRNWMEDRMSVFALGICIAIIAVMLCAGICGCIVNAERQALLEKYKWYIKLDMQTPTPTSYCYALHVVVSRYFGFVSFCCSPIYGLGHAINYYILHRGHKYSGIPPPQRPNSPEITRPM